MTHLNKFIQCGEQLFSQALRGDKQTIKLFCHLNHFLEASSNHLVHLVNVHKADTLKQKNWNILVLKFKLMFTNDIVLHKQEN